MNSLANARVCMALAAYGLLVGFSASAAAVAPASSLLPDKAIAALANEVSGDAAKNNLEGVVQFHRQRASKGFRSGWYSPK